MPNIYLQIISPKDRKLVGLLIQSEKKAKRLQDRLNKVGATGKKSTNDIGNSLGQLVARFAGPTAAVGVLIAKMRETYTLIREANREAAKAGRTTAEARGTALMNIGDFPGGAPAIDNIVKKIQAEIGGTLASIWESASVVLSNRRGQGADIVESTLRQITMMNRYTGGRIDAKRLAEMSLAMTNITGSSNAQANFGRLLQFQSTVPGNDPANLVNALPAALAGKSMGMKEERVLEFLSFIANRLGDTELRESSTAFSGFFSSVLGKKMFPSKQVNKKTGKTETKMTLVPGKTLEEKVKNIQKVFQDSDEETRADILKKFLGRAKVKASVYRPFLLQEPEAMQGLRAAERQIDPFDQQKALKKMQSIYSNITSGTKGRQLKIQTGFEAVKERLQQARAKSPDARYRIGKDALDKALAQLGYTGLSTAQFDLNAFIRRTSLGPAGGLKYVENIVEHSRKQLTGKESVLTGIPGADMFRAAFKDNIPELIKIEKLLEKLIAINEEQKTENKKSANANQRTAEAVSEKQGTLAD